MDLGMKRRWKAWVCVLACLLGTGFAGLALATSADTEHSSRPEFPRSLESYHDDELQSIGATLAHRIKKEPFNLAASLIFLFAIIHTFLTSRFLAVAHAWEAGHREKIARGEAHRRSVHIGAGIFHFLGEVEVVFGLWAVALGLAIIFFHDWQTVVGYVSHSVNFTEPLFVLVIMTLAATRPILKLAEKIMSVIAKLLGGTLAAWWFTILTVGPLLGSLITGPAAMTISALLLASKMYDLGPSVRFKYATIGLLFVNISIGGTLTHFAAPPVLMVAGTWGWGTGHMLANFGWKACVAILISNTVYFLLFRKELAGLQERYAAANLKEEIQHTYFSHLDLETELDKAIAGIDEQGEFFESLTSQLDEKADEVKAQLIAQLKERHGKSVHEKGIDMAVLREAFEHRLEELKLLRMRAGFAHLLPEHERPVFRDPEWDKRDDPVPAWVIAVHVCLMSWTIMNAHHPALFMFGLLFFLGFAHVTSPYQNVVDLKAPLLVGFFLGGLVIHGGVQAWWIAPVLGSLEEIPLLLAAAGLTAFNDNAAITFLSTLVPGFTEELKYAVVAGAVGGGGLTLIANAPNPAGQSLLKKYFDNGVSPAGLLKSALFPTLVVILCFLVF
jgi:hypothetical protein